MSHVKNDRRRRAAIEDPGGDERKAETGFTLLEAIVALAIAAGVLLTVVETLHATSARAERSEQIRTALLAAQSFLAEANREPLEGFGRLETRIGDVGIIATTSPLRIDDADAPGRWLHGAIIVEASHVEGGAKISLKSVIAVRASE